MTVGEQKRILVTCGCGARLALPGSMLIETADRRIREFYEEHRVCRAALRGAEALGEGEATATARSDIEKTPVTASLSPSAGLVSAAREALEGLREAYDYGCTWPIGFNTDPQEQRGMARDTLIRNMEFYADRLRETLAAVEAER